MKRLDFSLFWKGLLYWFTAIYVVVCILSIDFLLECKEWFILLSLVVASVCCFVSLCLGCINESEFRAISGYNWVERFIDKHIK